MRNINQMLCFNQTYTNYCLIQSISLNFNLALLLKLFYFLMCGEDITKFVEDIRFSICQNIPLSLLALVHNHRK